MVVLGLSIFGAIYLGLHGHSKVFLLFAVLFPAFFILNVVNRTRSRIRVADPRSRRDTLTGDRIAPDFSRSPLDEGLLRWVGGVDVPGPGGRRVFSSPLGVLELTEGQLTLRIRQRWLSRLAGLEPEILVVNPNGIEAIFPARGRRGGKAICIRPVDQPASYLLTGRLDRSAILGAAAATGFPVQWDELEYSWY